MMLEAGIDEQRISDVIAHLARPAVTTRMRLVRIANGFRHSALSTRLAPLNSPLRVNH